MVMERTMCNLEFIDKHKQETGPYEVTQLVNSFLGALAHPWEELKSEFTQKTIKEAEKDGWPKVSKDCPEDEDPKHLGDLLRLMRNGIAHGNIHFLPDGDCEIDSIRIVNIDTSGHRTWGTRLTVRDMRQFLDKFVETARKLKTAEKPA